MTSDLADYDRKKDLFYLSTISLDGVDETAEVDDVAPGFEEKFTKIVTTLNETSQSGNSQSGKSQSGKSQSGTGQNGTSQLDNSTLSTTDPTSVTVNNANMKVMAFLIAGQFSLLFFILLCLLSTTCVIYCMVKFKPILRISRTSDKNKDYELGSFGRSGRYKRTSDNDPIRPSSHEETTYRRLDNSYVDEVNRLEQHHLCPDL